MRVLAVDLGFSFGYGVLGADKPALSGSRKLKGSADDMGLGGHECDRFLREFIAIHKPTIIAFAQPFIGGKVTPVQLGPIMSWPTIVKMVCRELRIPWKAWDEAAARREFLGKGNFPRGSKKIKRAVMQACRDRGWPCCDDHAGDALCIAAFTISQLEPEKSHETTPLFSGGQTCRTSIGTPSESKLSSPSGPRIRQRRSRISSAKA